MFFEASSSARYFSPKRVGGLKRTTMGRKAVGSPAKMSSGAMSAGVRSRMLAVSSRYGSRSLRLIGQPLKAFCASGAKSSASSARARPPQWPDEPPK